MLKTLLIGQDSQSQSWLKSLMSRDWQVVFMGQVQADGKLVVVLEKKDAKETHAEKPKGD